MDHKQDSLSQFPIGTYTGSCGKREAFNRFFEKCREEEMKIVVVDPHQEKAMTASLPQEDMDSPSV